MTGHARDRLLLGMVTMGLLSLLLGCAKEAEPFQKLDGVWKYRETPIVDAHGPSFVALSDHYAKDKNRVYYADTYRKGQEYYAIKHDRIIAIEHADAATFALLPKGYARDSHGIYRDGRAIEVRDPASFEVLTLGNFARDQHIAYFDAIAIEGSDGASFVALNDTYAKDKSSVYYCQTLSTGVRESGKASVKLADADPASFEVLDSDYARDARHAFYRAQQITDRPDVFVVVGDGYAKTDSRVFYEGVHLHEAMAKSFVTTIDSINGVVGEDGVHRYVLGKRLTAQP